MVMIDALTGATYEKELMMYVRYHGYTLEEAQEIMSKQTHAERDNACAKIIQERK